MAALVAVAVLGAAVGTVVLVQQSALPEPAEPNVADPALRQAYATLSASGVLRPERLATAGDLGPTDAPVNVTLRTADRRWSVGPRISHPAHAASRTAPVRLAPGRVVAGRLRVEVGS